MNVVVVLTHTREGSLPSAEGRRRLQTAASLLEKGIAEYVLISGGLPGPDGRTLAEVYRDFLVAHGIDPAHVTLEASSRDTAESIRNIPDALERMSPHGPYRVWLVSNPRHLRRAWRTIRVLPSWRPIRVESAPSPSNPGKVEVLEAWGLDLYARVDPGWESRLADWMRARRARRMVRQGRVAGMKPGSRAPVPVNRVVVGIPCHNEARFVGPIVRTLVPMVHRVVVVDDGSTDHTARVAADAGALVIQHPTNQGYGRALRSCFETAVSLQADVLVTLDGDGQHDPAEVRALIRPIESGEADLVIGSRHLGAFAGIPAYRRLGIAVITGLYNSGARDRVTDAQSGYRAYHRSVFSRLEVKEAGMGASVEILVKARAMGFRFQEVPITCRYHGSGSSLNPVVHGVGVAWKVVEHRARAWLEEGRHGRR